MTAYVQLSAQPEPDTTNSINHPQYVSQAPPPFDQCSARVAVSCTGNSTSHVSQVYARVVVPARFLDGRGADGKSNVFPSLGNLPVTSVTGGTWHKQSAERHAHSLRENFVYIRCDARHVHSRRLMVLRSECKSEIQRPTESAAWFFPYKSPNAFRITHAVRENFSFSRAGD